MNVSYITSALQKNESMLIKQATRLTKDINTAYDLYQETAYRALKHAGRFTEDTNAQAWLVTIMRNLFINDYRKKKRRQTLQDGTPNNYLLNATEAEVYNGGESEFDYQSLLCIVDDLDESLRIPFVLNYEGYKYEEIAEQLDIPLGTVKSRIFFARKRMKAAVKQHYGVVPSYEPTAA
jgi:RNA polymerase sigma-70 factor (ECF subfamily)